MNLAEKLTQLLGQDKVLSDLATKEPYLYDEVNLHVRPTANTDSVVVFPTTTQEVCQVVQLANEIDTPIVARGAGTGLSGGAVPTYKSIVISLERMNQIVEVDKNNMVVTVEAGVTLEQLYKEMDKHEGIWFPAHPAFDTASLGGIVATNGGGARAIRHGIMRRHVLGLEVVLPSGEVLTLGGKLIKDNAGLNLMHLIIGSEGTLAIVTKVIIKLYAEDLCNGTLLGSFSHVNDASKACLAILQAGVVPLAIEYQDRALFVGGAEVMNQRLGTKATWPLTKGQSDLMVVISESTQAGYNNAIEKIKSIFHEHSVMELYETENKKEAKQLMDIRAHYYYYVKPNLSHFFDMTVPMANIPNFFKDLEQLFAQYGTKTHICAHIADGNLHNEIMLDEQGNIAPYAQELQTAMYNICLSYGGTITGEHGIGKIRVKHLSLQRTQTEIDIMQGIKQVFDPKGLLNPDTIIKSSKAF